MTVIPNLLVTGALAVLVALAVGVWSGAFVERPHDALVVVGLSVLVLLVGDGFAPPEARQRRPRHADREVPGRLLDDVGVVLNTSREGE